ncbi:hypothetical protein [Microbacterium sp. YY-01]|uniref:hypothetical protein n=1 Tax=Microbacterium sp. YY-01 TaxID=3421634 RepID=UPI003D165E63
MNDRPYRGRDGQTPRDNSGRPYQARDGGGYRDRSYRDNPRHGADDRRREGRDDRARYDNRERAPRRFDDREPRERRYEDRPRDPRIPDEITARDLHPAARNELKTLSKENGDTVARHLAMAARLIDTEPALAHEHALAAGRRAGRVAVVRETVAITAYAVEDFALALRELRTYRRISGSDDQIALMVDSERGVGRPDRALELGRSVDPATLPAETRAALAIAMSGARLDRGETELALGELQIAEANPDRAFSWSPALFRARAAVLEDLGRADEAAFWHERARIAAEALGESEDTYQEIVIDDLEDDAEIDVAEIDDVEIDTADIGGAEGSEEEAGAASGSVETAHSNEVADSNESSETHDPQE